MQVCWSNDEIVGMWKTMNQNYASQPMVPQQSRLWRTEMARPTWDRKILIMLVLAPD
jgi:hypothetical protein